MILVFQYPLWLSEHKSTLPPSEFSNYEQQYAYTQQICEAFEEEQDSDSDEVKAQHFTKIMNLMQEVSFKIYNSRHRRQR